MPPYRSKQGDPENVQCGWCHRLATPELTTYFGRGIDDTIQACHDHSEQYRSALERHYWEEADRAANPQAYEIALRRPRKKHRWKRSRGS